MTKERKLEILKDLLIQLSDSANILCTCEADERCEVVEECIKTLEQQPSDDCVSRQAVIDLINADWKYEGLELSVKDLPPVTPTHCIAAVRFSKEDLRDICNERIELECTHGTCEYCKQLGVMDCGYYCKLNHWGKISTEGNCGGMGDWYCKDFEKRGDKE